MIVRPDFLVIGAMKSMTSSLHDQLSLSPELNLSTLKEPCFFSDDENFTRGTEWYASCWKNPHGEAFLGESSTHYSKLPTYPDTVSRMYEFCPDVKLIYVIRNPLDRLVSQYIHEWTVGRISVPIDIAIHRYPMLVDYSRYAFQLRPYFEFFEPRKMLVVSFESLKCNPSASLFEISNHLGLRESIEWDHSVTPSNVSSRRMKTSRMRDAVVHAPGIDWMRKKIVPQSVRNRIKDLWRMKDRPELSSRSIKHLRSIFDEDLIELSGQLEATAGKSVDAQSDGRNPRRHSSPVASKTEGVV